MKVLLVSLNAKYIHTNLAIRYLENFCNNMSNIDIKIREFTINDQIAGVLREIYLEKADVVAFSCYIWNIQETIKIARMLKSVRKNTTIVLGGPEVSFYGQDWMKEIPEIDYIVKGEGENTFKNLLLYINNNHLNNNICDIKGIIYRRDNEIVENEDQHLIDDLTVIPFPYNEDLSSFENKIIYYESSRGCPFNCQYCLSSTIRGVRFFPLSRVKRELSYFIDAGVKQIKFVDRTFNCNKERTIELLNYLIKKGGSTNFHFEIAADLIDQETLDLLQKAPTGLFQLEIGVQSTKEQTLEAIDRKNDFSRIKNVVSSIKSFKNIHQHLDLIAGLPYEGYNDFKNSFNDVYRLKPDMLQLGFLKLLKGSGIEINKALYEYKYTPFPPYEVLSNQFISFSEIIKLKYIEDLLEKFSNSHIFDFTLDFIISNYYENPFDFFEDFSFFWINNKLFERSHSQKTLYKILMDFIYQKKWDKEKKAPIEILKFDFLLTHRSPLPSFFIEEEITNKKEKIFEFLKQEDNIRRILPGYEGRRAKEIFKYIHIEKFNVNILEELNLETISKNKKNITLLFDFKDSQKDIHHKNSYYEVEL